MLGGLGKVADAGMHTRCTISVGGQLPWVCAACCLMGSWDIDGVRSWGVNQTEVGFEYTECLCTSALACLGN